MRRFVSSDHRRRLAGEGKDQNVTGSMRRLFSSDQRRRLAGEGKDQNANFERTSTPQSVQLSQQMVTSHDDTSLDDLDATKVLNIIQQYMMMLSC